MRQSRGWLTERDCGADGDKGYFRRHPEANRQDTSADARAHKQMPSSFDDMPDGIPLAKLRGHDRPSQSRHRHLSAMGVAG